LFSADPASCACLPAWWTTSAATAAALTAASAAAVRASAAATAAAAKATPFRAWPSFVHDEITTAQVGAVEGADRLFSLIFVGHLDEGKSAGATRLAILYQVNRIHLSVRFKSSTDLVFRRGERKVPDVKSFHRDPPLKIESGDRSAKREGSKTDLH
jgi:hypothetical protein